MRLIDADALVENLELIAKYQPDCKQSTILGVCATIRATKAVDAEPVRHGYWIQSKSVPAYHSCSYCHAAHKMHESCNTYVLLNYCPNCGAKMDGDSSAKS